MGEPHASDWTWDPRGNDGRGSLAIAAKASPETVAKNDPDDPNGRKIGDRVRVVPDDYARVEVSGEIVSLSAQHIAIRRIDERIGEIVVHFPRAGFLVTA
jgi:hypothetical protein